MCRKLGVILYAFWPQMLAILQYLFLHIHDIASIVFSGRTFYYFCSTNYCMFYLFWTKILLFSFPKFQPFSVQHYGIFLLSVPKVYHFQSLHINSLFLVPHSTIFRLHSLCIRPFHLCPNTFVFFFFSHMGLCQSIWAHVALL